MISLFWICWTIEINSTLHQKYYKNFMNVWINIYFIHIKLKANNQLNLLITYQFNNPICCEFNLYASHVLNYIILYSPQQKYYINFFSFYICVMGNMKASWKSEEKERLKFHVVDVLKNYFKYYFVLWLLMNLQ